MDDRNLGCCVAPSEPKMTISDKEKEITEVLNMCVDAMNGLLSHVSNAEPILIGKVEVTCLEHNVSYNLGLAKTLAEQICNLRQAF